jgi:hypothetical protein
MSPQKRRPQARKGRTASAARAGRRKTDRTSWLAAAVIVIVGILLVVFLKPSPSSGVQLGDHWHAALGVYACDKWDGNADWPTPVNPSTGTPVRANTAIYAGLHSHKDGLIHMEPQTSDEVGRHATLGSYFTMNGFELSSTHVKFVSADLKNGDKCGKLPGKLHWLVNGKERTGNPAAYVLHNLDWIVVAFLPDTTKITSLGKPPSFANLAKQTGGTHPPATPAPSTSTPSSSSTPSSTSTPSSSSTPTSASTPST